MPWEELTLGGAELSFTELQLRWRLIGLSEYLVKITLLMPNACRSHKAFHLLRMPLPLPEPGPPC